MRNIAFSALVCILVLASCSRAKVFEKYTDIKGNVWNRFEVVTFDVNIEDISAAYDFYVAFRHMDQFPLDNIVIQFNFETPSGEARYSKQKIVLKDTSGKWLGNGMGDLWDVEQLVRPGYKFTEPGICKVEVSSAMQNADLPGIMQVGLIVRKSR